MRSCHDLEIREDAPQERYVYPPLFVRIRLCSPTPTVPSFPPTTNITTGKSWHTPKTRFTPSTATLTSYQQRTAKTALHKEVKAKEAELKAEKEAERQQRIQGIRAKRERKEEQERWQKLEEKMHAKRVERRKRREKRNKLLKS